MKTRGEKIYSPEEQQDILYNLKENRLMPTKYIYFDFGALKWIKIARSRLNAQGKGINILERIMLTQKARAIFDCLPRQNYRNFNLIDLGCGDGSPTYPLLRHLKQEFPNSQVRYNPIDISSDMLSIASKNIGRGFEAFGKINRWDFERGPFKEITKKLYSPNFGNLYMFLGSTFGNMPDLNQTLVNIRKSMNDVDFLLLGVELLVESEVGTMLREYYDIRDIYDLLFTSLEFFGLKRSSGEFRITFNKKLSQVECYYIPTKDKTLTTSAGKILLQKAKAILLARSVKFTPAMISEIASHAGFRIELLTTSNGNNYALVLLQPLPSNSD